MLILHRQKPTPHRPGWIGDVKPDIQKRHQLYEDLVRQAAGLFGQLAPLLLQSEDGEPAADQMQFDAIVRFTRPMAGRQTVSTTDEGAESLFAESPVSAARKWLWRLSAEERAAVDDVVVCAPHTHGLRAVYDGPTAVFRREGTALVEIERRD
jgi:hypothetical protein